MLFLLCSVLSSAMISVVMRLSQGRIRGSISMLAANYLTCMVCGWGFIGLSNTFPTENGIQLTLLLGAVNGVVYVISLILTQYNVRRNGVVLQSVFSKLGDLMVPLITAILVFGERPMPLQAVGAVLAVAAILIMNLSPQKQAAGSMLFLFLLFAADGCASTMSKVYGEIGAEALSSHFLLYTFGAAFLLCAALVLIKRERPGLAELGFGAAIGVPNYFSSRFLLRALDRIPAVIAYPVRSVGVIVVIAAVGLLFFRERLRKNQWAAIALILAAVTLLSM